MLPGAAVRFWTNPDSLVERPCTGNPLPRVSIAPGACCCQKSCIRELKRKNVMEILQLWAAGLECWPVFTLEKDPGDPGDPDVPLNVLSKAAAALCFLCLPQDKNLLGNSGE